MHIQDNDTQRNLSTVSEPSEMKQNLVPNCIVRSLNHLMIYILEQNCIICSNVQVNFRFAIARLFRRVYKISSYR